MENKNQKVVCIVMIVAIIAVISMCGVLIFRVINNGASENTNNEVNVIENKQKNNDELNEEDNNTDANTQKTGMDSWNGTYEKGNFTIKLYRKGKNKIDFTLTKVTDGNKFTSVGKEFESNSDSEIVYEDESFGENISIKILKTSKGLQIKASSNESDSILNECNGEYSLKSYSSSNWDGIYEYNGNTIVLAEVAKNELYMSVIPKEYSWATWSKPISEYSETKIDYDKKWFEDTEKVKITKTSTGIKVETSSTEEDSKLNEISGTYTKQ